MSDYRTRQTDSGECELFDGDEFLGTFDSTLSACRFASARNIAAAQPVPCDHAERIADERTIDTFELECGARVAICLASETYESHSPLALADLLAARIRTHGRWAL